MENMEIDSKSASRKRKPSLATEQLEIRAQTTGEKISKFAN